MNKYRPGQKVVFLSPGGEEDEVCVGTVEETPDQYDGFYLIDDGTDVVPILPKEICYSIDD